LGLLIRFRITFYKNEVWKSFSLISHAYIHFVTCTIFGDINNLEIKCYQNPHEEWFSFISHNSLWLQSCFVSQVRTAKQSSNFFFSVLLPHYFHWWLSIVILAYLENMLLNTYNYHLSKITYNFIWIVCSTIGVFSEYFNESDLMRAFAVIMRVGSLCINYIILCFKLLWRFCE
jgi:hypothetical protein